MNFMFSWQEQYLTSEIFLPREHKIHIFEPMCNVLFIIWRHADDAVFDDFPKISDHFPKIAEDDRRRSEDVSIIHQQI